MWDVAKAMLRGTYSTECIHWKKEKSRINKLSFYLKILDKEDQIKSKASRRKYIIKITAEINKIEISTENNKTKK